jgi:hypothetical protein
MEPVKTPDACGVVSDQRHEMMERIIAIQKQAVDLCSTEDSCSPVANSKLIRRVLE